MKIRLVISVLSLILAVSLGILSAEYTDNLCSGLSRQVRAAADNRDAVMLQQAQEQWQKRVPLLSTFIPHGHIDRLTETLVRASEFLKNDELSEFDAEIGCAIHQFGVIGKYDCLSVRALF